MQESATTALRPGDVQVGANGERFGRSTGGRLVQLRRRVSEPGFVVTVDAQPRAEVPAEVITTGWTTANTAFERLMREY
ncbi:hypothetical protein [Saccharopolyspora montiporae]|nr:hypothetical protein [Saccharopolyspora sp. HNM0983]